MKISFENTYIKFQKQSLFLKGNAIKRILLLGKQTILKTCEAAMAPVADQNQRESKELDLRIPIQPL